MKAIQNLRIKVLGKGGLKKVETIMCRGDTTRQGKEILRSTTIKEACLNPEEARKVGSGKETIYHHKRTQNTNLCLFIAEKHERFFSLLSLKLFFHLLFPFRKLLFIFNFFMKNDLYALSILILISKTNRWCKNKIFKLRG